MERKGFTLVELLAVIVLLSLVIIIVATSGFGAFNNAKESINNIEEKNLLEAAKTYLVEIDNELCSTLTASECTDLRTSCLSGCTLTVSEIEVTGYFTDKKNKCDNDAELFLQIKVDGSGNTIGYTAEKKTDAEGNEVAICVN